MRRLKDTDLYFSLSNYGKEGEGIELRSTLKTIIYGRRDEMETWSSVSKYGLSRQPVVSSVT